MNDTTSQAMREEANESTLTPSAAGEWENYQILPPRSRQIRLAPTEAQRESKRKAHAKHEEKLMQKETEYFTMCSRTRPEVIRALTDKLMLLSDISDKGAKLHLRLNLNQEVEADLLSDDPFREQRAIHRLDYGILDDVFTNSERRLLRDMLASEEGGYPSRCLSEARIFLTESQKNYIRSTWPKTPADFAMIIEWLKTAYDLERSRKRTSLQQQRKKQS